MHKGRQWLAEILGRIGIAGIAAVASLFLFAQFSAEFGEQGGRLPQFDHAVLAYFHAHRINWLFQFAYWVSWLFRPLGLGIFVLVAGTAFFLSHRRDAALTLLVGALGGALVVSLLKTLFARPRPEEIFAPLGYSFPSGHTFGAVTVLGITGYYLAREIPVARRVWIWCVSVAGMLLVGLSRVYLGEHYPSDVGAGYTAAFCWVWICLYVSRVVHNKGIIVGKDTPPKTVE